jgi:citrate lyase subunit beta / citryl-CoA lyase
MSAPSLPQTHPHPRQALFDAGETPPALPACDHYAGTEELMRKSLALQQDMGDVFDLTLDCEDGAPIGGEAEHAHMVAALALAAQKLSAPGGSAAQTTQDGVALPVSRPRWKHAVGRSRLVSHNPGRVGARVHPASHPSFVDDVKTLLGQRADHGLAYVMVPKVRDLAELEAVCAEVDRQCNAGASASQADPDSAKVPIHVLVETHGALRDVHAIAAHPRVELLAFGLMDFVSAHRGAIPSSAMSAQGQFAHPLVVRAKLEIAAACHAYGKTPSHCVITEFKSLRAVATAALRAATELGYLRMWSIHPRQIRPIVEAFAPSAAETEHALEIIRTAQAAAWAPIRYESSGQAHLHDRASYRYYWQVIERARRTGQVLPAWAEAAWF